MKNEFIAWDKKKERFLSSYDVAINGEGEIYKFGRSSEADGYISEVFNIEILEYSGKKDRNGTKLYRGDIVKATLPMCEDRFNSDEDLVSKTIIGVVVIRPSEGAKLLVKKIIPKDVIGITKGRSIRIKQDQDLRIGHIYTDPKLVEEEKAI